MSSACDELDAIIVRLRITLREIEGGMRATVPPSRSPASGRLTTMDDGLVGLSAAKLAADRLRYTAHFRPAQHPAARTVMPRGSAA